ncbi:MAG: barstar family protein [Cyanobacteria bacterium]|nr:barstar family protein [Cyanobacteriota bacterium]
MTRGATDLGFATFQIDGNGLQTKDDLLDGLAVAAKFPSYFGRNWDAASDLLRDLSWVPAEGYVLIITASENLLRMGMRDFVTFMRVVEATIRDWRDERGEFGERAAPIAFHLVLCGANVLKAELGGLLTEPLCEHSSPV